MTDVKAILARLQNGESADDIANEFATLINDAVKLNDAEIQKQKEAEAKAALEENLNAKAQAILDALYDYVSAAAPDLAAELGDDSELYDVEQLRSIVDSALAGVKLSLSIAKSFNDEPKADPKVAPSADDKIKQFLKNFGL